MSTAWGYGWYGNALGLTNLPVNGVASSGTLLTNYQSTAVTLSNAANAFTGSFFAPTNGAT
jgi:hypothetical protein